MPAVENVIHVYLRALVSHYGGAGIGLLLVDRKDFFTLVRGVKDDFFLSSVLLSNYVPSTVLRVSYTFLI